MPLRSLRGATVPNPHNSPPPGNLPAETFGFYEFHLVARVPYESAAHDSPLQEGPRTSWRSNGSSVLVMCDACTSRASDMSAFSAAWTRRSGRAISRFRTSLQNLAAAHPPSGISNLIDHVTQ